MVFSVCFIPDNAAFISTSDDIIACAHETKNDYHEAVDKFDAEISQEYLSNSYEANETYNKILESIESSDNELRSHFSGAYVNDSGYLVVALCCASGNCKKEIENNLSCSEIIYEDATGSYYYGQKELDAINEKIASLQEDIKSGNVISAEEQVLMQSKPRTNYNTQDNTISIIFNGSEDIEKAVVKSEKSTNNSDAEKACIVFSDSELEALNQYNNLIDSFRNIINCANDITYTICTGYQSCEDQTDTCTSRTIHFCYN